MQAVIESVVTAMVNAKIASADAVGGFGLGSHARRDRRRSAAPLGDDSPSPGRRRSCTHKGADVGFEGLSGNRMLDQSITGFDPLQTFV